MDELLVDEVVVRALEDDPTGDPLVRGGGGGIEAGGEGSEFEADGLAAAFKGGDAIGHEVEGEGLAGPGDLGGFLLIRWSEVLGEDGAGESGESDGECRYDLIESHGWRS